MRTVKNSAELFRHVSAEKSALYRNIMDSFAAAKRQFRLHLRPDEVLAEGEWSGTPPRIEEIQSALAQLAEWGNLESHNPTPHASPASATSIGLALQGIRQHRKCIAKPSCRFRRRQ